MAARKFFDSILKVTYPGFGNKKCFAGQPEVVVWHPGAKNVFFCNDVRFYFACFVDSVISGFYLGGRRGRVVKHTLSEVQLSTLDLL